MCGFQDEIALLKHCQSMTHACTMTIGLAMLVLIAAWIADDKIVSEYSRDWVPSRVTAKSQSAALRAESVLDEAANSAHLLDSSHRCPS